MEYNVNERRGTDEPFLNFMAIGGSALLKLLGLSAEEAANYHFRAIVLKEKSLKPDVEGIPMLEGRDRRVYLEFQGYKDPFIRYRLMAKVMAGCAHDHFGGSVFAGIVYTDNAYREAALAINAFSGQSDLGDGSWLTEVSLTDYWEENLQKIDEKLVARALHGSAGRKQRRISETWPKMAAGDRSGDIVEICFVWPCRPRISVGDGRIQCIL